MNHQPQYEKRLSPADKSFPRSQDRFYNAQWTELEKIFIWWGWIRGHFVAPTGTEVGRREDGT